MAPVGAFVRDLTSQRAIYYTPRSIGAALVPAGVSDALFHSDTIVPLFEHELGTDEEYYVVCRPEDAERPHVAAFIDWVLQEYGNA